MEKLESVNIAFFFVLQLILDNRNIVIFNARK